jgi:UDP-N-acetylmuramoyl-tripeptide--D-alanyl-D-alanine ligase
MKMTLENVAKACSGRLFVTEEKKNPPVIGGVTDNRQIEEGNLFFAIRGEKTDGHKYAQAAFEAGASAVVLEYVPEDYVGNYILVESTQQALKDIAAYYRSLLTIPVIGIAGSVGKTSTKEMVASVLSQKYKVLKTAGNFNNEIGMPLTLLRIREEHEVAVVEMGINHFGEMERLTKVAVPDLFVMTNIGACHLENLGDLDGVLKAKTEGFPIMKENTPLVINADDEKLYSLREDRHMRPLLYGIEKTEGLAYADEILSQGEAGTDALIHVGGESARVHISVPGKHMVLNALAAACVGKELGLSMQEIADGIEAMRTIAGRSNFLHENGKTVIDDCYNANPASMKASLEVLSHCKGRRIAVLGDMGELGSDERKLHRQVGEFVAGLGLDQVYLCGSLTEEMKEPLFAANTKVIYCKEKEALIEALLQDSKKGDTILVKASHFMGFEEVVSALVK